MKASKTDTKLMGFSEEHGILQSIHDRVIKAHPLTEIITDTKHFIYFWNYIYFKILFYVKDKFIMLSTGNLFCIMYIHLSVYCNET